MSVSFETAFEFTRLEAGRAAQEENVPERTIFHSLLCRANIYSKCTDTKRLCSESYPIPGEALLSPPKATELKDAIVCFQHLGKRGKLRQPGSFQTLQEV